MDSRTLRPVYDADLRELRWMGLLVKRFLTFAPMQELVLKAFQEQGWPVRVDDPLPPSPTQPQRRRLHDTINGLNRSPMRDIISFHGDGSGEGIVWRLTLSDSTLIKNQKYPRFVKRVRSPRD